MADQSLTKLITVSLGKIQQTKQDKRGQSLRRSLLVASVLSQARTEYIAEIKLKRIQSQQSERQKELNNNNNNQPQPESTLVSAIHSSPRKRKFMSQRSCSESQSAASSKHSASDQQTHDTVTESCAPTTITDLVLNEIETTSETNNKENSLPDSQADMDSNSFSQPASCKRCFKRSLSTTESSTTNSVEEERGSSEVKRIKTESMSDIANLTNRLSNSFMEFTTTSTASSTSNITSSQCGSAMADFNCFAVRQLKVDNTVALEA